ncbi:MAG: alpha/beta hydrolase [Verrucomicrobia bacterium]|nr:MAG: alpha/beta hydrolase [Verrucomicrobiota bacterium]
MSYFEFKIESYDELKLHGQSWEPDIEAKAVVCLVHGLGEHGGRYSHVGEVFNQAGYALMISDLRGHGKSDGQRGHAPNYTALMDDIFQLLEAAKERYPDVPLFLYGHSLGGNLAIHYALRRLPKLTGVVATAPLFRTTVKPPAWKLVLLRAMVGVRPSLSISSGLETAALSRDSQVIQVYLNDPLTHDRISARLAMDMLRNGEWNMVHAANLPCPLLLMHGAADRITSPGASREFALRAGAGCTLKIWDGFFHELHNEPGKHDILAFALRWIEGRAAK